MKTIFRLQRYGVAVPRLLATGQKQIKPWQTQSFLLTEPLQPGVQIYSFLRTAPPAARRLVLCQAARTLRQIHRANCYLRDHSKAATRALLTVGLDRPHGPKVALATIHSIEKSPHPNPRRARRDLAALARCFGEICSKTDLLCGLLAYIGQKRLAGGARLFARRLLDRLRVPVREYGSAP